MKFLLSILLFFGVFSCDSSGGDTTPSVSDGELTIDDQPRSEGKREHMDTITVLCPKHHSDSIVPIVFGYPSEELFEMAERGEVVLGGCELPEDYPKYYCKKHQLEF